MAKKKDIEDAFRIIHVNPAEYHLLGFSWDNVFYLDICLPMGLVVLVEFLKE